MATCRDIHANYDRDTIVVYQAYTDMDELVQDLLRSILRQPQGDLRPLQTAVVNSITRERHIDGFLRAWVRNVPRSDDAFAIGVLAQTGNLLPSYAAHRFFNRRWRRFERHARGLSPDETTACLRVLVPALGHCHPQVSPEWLLEEFASHTDPEIRWLALEALARRGTGLAHGLLDRVIRTHRLRGTRRIARRLMRQIGGW